MKKLLMFLFLSAFVAHTYSQVCFTTSNYAVGISNEAITSSDFNNDGKLDLAVSSYNDSPGIFILLGNGSGTFAAPVNAIDSTQSRSIVSADFNSDGNADIASLVYGNPGLVKVWFGNGTGSFPASDSLAVGAYPFAICSADFNGDGKPDLATATGGGGPGGAYVLLNNGAGSFSAADYSAGDGPIAITSGDFNGDGKMDLAVANDGNGGGLDSVGVLLGNGSGSFGTAITYAVGSGPYSVSSGDYNGDGFGDLVVANTNSDNVSVLLSHGSSGTFFPAVNYPTSSQPFSVVSADFNLDGKEDIATGNHSNSVSVLLGNGAGIFNPQANFLAAYGPWTIITSDFNADGRPDLATANQSSTNVAVLMNTISNNCIGCALNSSVAVPKICVVSTDSASSYKYNNIVWDKTLYQGVDSFIIYRYDVASVSYLRIGAVSKDSLSVFRDTAFSIGGPNGGNPLYSSWQYKIAIRDTCGNTGAKSPYHQTMFVQESGATFSWNPYTVEAGQVNPVTGYSFLRDDNNSGNWHVLVNTAGNSTTDPNYSVYPNGNWRVDALGFNCTPSMLMAGNNNNASSQNRSHSNTSKPAVTGIEQIKSDSQAIIIAPNPSPDYLKIVSPKELGMVSVWNSLGEIVVKIYCASTKTEIDVSNLPAGIYTIQLNYSRMKFVKE